MYRHCGDGEEGGAGGGNVPPPNIEAPVVPPQSQSCSAVPALVTFFVSLCSSFNLQIIYIKSCQLKTGRSSGDE